MKSMKAQWYGIQLWCQGQGFKTHILLFLDGGVDSLHLRVDEVRLDVVLHKNWKSKHCIEKSGSRSTQLFCWDGSIGPYLIKIFSPSSYTLGFRLRIFLGEFALGCLRRAGGCVLVFSRDDSWLSWPYWLRIIVSAPFFMKHAVRCQPAQKLE